MELFNYNPRDYPPQPGQRPAPVKQQNGVNLDQRTWEWYKLGRKARDPVWTGTYIFFDENGQLTYPGVTCAAPVRRADGSLLGVIGFDLDVFALCRFLKGLTISANGFAFVVEQRPDGTRKLIAHPDQKVLLHEVGATKGGRRRRDLVDIEALRDRRVPAFMRQVPADVDPETLDGMRPVRFREDGVSYLGGYRGLDEPSEPRWLICLVIPEDDVLGQAKRNTRIILIVAGGVLVLAIVLSLLTSAQVARPLEELARDAEAIGRLELNPRPVGHSHVREVERLACATEDMKTSLRSFRKYVPADLVRKLMQSGQEAKLGGEERRLTIYFSDIADFTNISESLTPNKLVEHLSEYLQALSEQILATGGTVDKYIGDAIMAFWGAPLENSGHALAACTAAVRNQQALRQLRDKWRAEGKPPFSARIGINTGEVVVGNIGSASRLNYTVIGDAVNLASRLEGLNKYYGTAVLIADSTYQEARAGIVARPLDWVSVKGKSEAVLVHELLGLKGEVGGDVEELAGLYEQALAAYREQSWTKAVGLFEQVRQRWPEDGPAREMLLRCEVYRSQPPGAGWDGVHRMHTK
jgi:adenylate cyclase